MPSWWGKSSSKEAKGKTNRESIFGTIKRKLRNASENKCNGKSGASRRHHRDSVSWKGSWSLVSSRSTSPASHVSRCQSFGPHATENKYNSKSGGSRRHHGDSVWWKGSWSVVSSRSTSPSRHMSRCQSFGPHSQSHQLPSVHLPTLGVGNSGTNIASKLERARDAKPSLYIPLLEPVNVSNKGDPIHAERDTATASVSSDSSIDSGNSSDSHLISPLVSDCENGNRANTNNSYRAVQNYQSICTIKKKSRASSKPTPQLHSNKLLSSSPKGGPLYLQDMQITRPGGLHSTPDSSRSSPSRSPMRAFGHDSGLCRGKPYPDIASGICSSLGSGHNSGHNSVGGEMSGQIFWQRSRCSPECSPVPSSRMTSPGPSSRIQSAAVSPRHPRAGFAVAEQQTHQLPLPLNTVISSCPLSPAYSESTTPSAPRSPARAENQTSPGPWKKGRLLGRGTFGHVYLGFNRESGGMCAMKEVTLFSDDPKSRESAQQLDQEIALLSHLRHPNIVQYYGSALVDDKLYIYLEYVSGGSIYKVLQQYGRLSEILVRNYTRQILSGLAYLHAKNTVHRDIKGANILVDPHGCIKLSDFGMAKHISGQSCPFSFKGSPYWLAPEVIKNSKGCNLAVDIWSLGCTVLEMLTTKPPWSQYEGVAAIFKIGNSKEYPVFPDHLSEDGKDFLRLCLQRNPQNRPSAAQLLEHPFVKNAKRERSIVTADPPEAPDAVINAVRSVAIGPAKYNLSLDSKVAGNYPPISFRTGKGSSDAPIPRIISCPVSPSGSQRTLRVSGRRSTSPISSPHTASGSSTPLTIVGGSIPFHHQTKQPIFSYEAVGMIQKLQSGFYSNGAAHQEPNHDQFLGIPQTTNACYYSDRLSSDYDAQVNHNTRVVQAELREFHDAKSCLADRVSQQLLRDYVRLNISQLDVKSNAPRID